MGSRERQGSAAGPTSVQTVLSLQPKSNGTRGNEIDKTLYRTVPPGQLEDRPLNVGKTISSTVENYCHLKRSS